VYRADRQEDYGATYWKIVKEAAFKVQHFVQFVRKNSPNISENIARYRTEM
jgi:hypothetical protein